MNALELTHNNLYTSVVNYISLDHETVAHAREIFAVYQADNVISSTCHFEDPVWLTTDEYSNIGFHFRFKRHSYKRNGYEKIFGLSFDDFVDYVKVYLLSHFGKKVLFTLNNILLDLRHIIDTDIEDIYGITDRLRIYFPSFCADFFSALPDVGDNIDVNDLIDALEQYADVNILSGKNSQRQLWDMDTYLRFDDIIKTFWGSELSPDVRLFYSPLYLWWTITGTIPLRPREFLLIPRDCLKKKDDGYYLTIRRNQLKGNRQDVHYKISEDYSTDTYKIPPKLGEEIEEYIKMTSQFDSTDLDTLFVTDPHYGKWGRNKRPNSRFLSRVNLYTILQYFYKEIIVDQYHYDIVFDNTGGFLSDGKIGRISLGDTRHISLINLMEEGGTPTIAMYLAGHANATMASHYYSNITRLIECKTYHQYRRLIGDKQNFEISTSAFLPASGQSRPLSNGGKCYSTAYYNGSIDDCVKTISDDGEIGHCPSCPYYRHNNVSFFSGDDIYKRQIKDDFKLLVEAISIVRQDKGSFETIGEALNRIQSSATSYQQYLMAKHMELGN